MQITAETMQTYDLYKFAMHDLTAQLYLKFLLITQHDNKKGQVTEQRTANVQMSRTVEVV